MRDYNISGTVRFDEKVYGAETVVNGPETLEEFQELHGSAGVLDILVRDFKADQAATLRGRIAAKIGKTAESEGGRLANATRVELD